MSGCNVTDSHACILVSDNHGDEHALLDLVSLYEETISCFLHCGDSESHVSDPIWTHMKTVKGNMDRESAFPEKRIVSLGDKKVLVTHGHLQGVKRDLTQLKVEAKEEQVDVVCFGHTHIPFCKREDGILYVNPGSISLPKGTHPQKSYALLTLEGDSFYVQYYNENHSPINVFN